MSDTLVTSVLWIGTGTLTELKTAEKIKLKLKPEIAREKQLDLAARNRVDVGHWTVAHCHIADRTLLLN